MAAGAGVLFLNAFHGKNKKNVDWSVCDHDGNGLLFYGISSGDIECVKEILDRKDSYVHLSRMNNNNDNVLHTVINKCIELKCHIGNFDCILKKLEQLSGEYKYSALRDQFTFDRLLNHANKNGDTPAHMLVRNPQVLAKKIIIMIML